MSTPTSWQQALEVEGLRTPFLALDLPRLMANIEDMAHRVHARGGRMTPHQKTHKCVEIGRLQTQSGAERATVATVAEARLAFDSGFSSVLVAYPPIPHWRAGDYAELTELGAVAVTCSTPEQVEALNATGASFEVYWEVDSGTKRLGTSPGSGTATSIGRSPFLSRTPLTGLMTFAGHAYGATNEVELQAVRQQQDTALSETQAALQWLPDHEKQLSVGVTPLARVDSDLASEYRYGNYVFYDASQVALGGPRLDECSLAVVSTVIDVPGETRLVIDAGAKSLPAETMTACATGLGAVVGHPEIVIEKLFEEHGLCASDRPHRLQVGDRVAVIPNHACTAVNLYSQYSVFNDSGHIDTWPIQGRRR